MISSLSCVLRQRYRSDRYCLVVLGVGRAGLGFVQQISPIQDYVVSRIQDSEVT